MSISVMKLCQATHCKTGQAWLLSCLLDRSLRKCCFFRHTTGTTRLSVQPSDYQLSRTVDSTPSTPIHPPPFTAALPARVAVGFTGSYRARARAGGW